MSTWGSRARARMGGGALGAAYPKGETFDFGYAKRVLDGKGVWRLVGREYDRDGDDYHWHPSHLTKHDLSPEQWEEWGPRIRLPTPAEKKMQDAIRRIDWSEVDEKGGTRSLEDALAELAWVEGWNAHGSRKYENAEAAVSSILADANGLDHVLKKLKIRPQWIKRFVEAFNMAAG